MNDMTTTASKKLTLSPRELSDVGLILNGAFAPLNGLHGPRRLRARG